MIKIVGENFEGSLEGYKRAHNLLEAKVQLQMICVHKDDSENTKVDFDLQQKIFSLLADQAALLNEGD